MSEVIIELFGVSTESKDKLLWQKAIKDQHCPYLGGRCIKVRKSEPEISIGTCTVRYGKFPTLICPYRLVERRQIFTDSLHLLTLHEPGNELHLVPEVTIPGGSVDYFLVSVHDGKPVDFVGMELQTLDTTGTVWPARQRFLKSVGITTADKADESEKTFGMNWKHTAKTTLIQLHHKVQTFEHLGKHLVLVIQDCFLDYMKKEFTFGHLKDARAGDSMHFHAYALEKNENNFRLQLVKRLSTDAAGISTALGLKAEAKVELEVIVADIQRKLSKQTLWSPV